jgi:hypothetical protein
MLVPPSALSCGTWAHEGDSLDDGSNLDARTSLPDDDEKRLSCDGSNSDARTMSFHLDFHSITTVWVLVVVTILLARVVA